MHTVGYYVNTFINLCWAVTLGMLMLIVPFLPLIHALVVIGGK